MNNDPNNTLNNTPGIQPQINNVPTIDQQISATTNVQPPIENVDNNVAQISTTPTVAAPVNNIVDPNLPQANTPLEAAQPTSIEDIIITKEQQDSMMKEIKQEPEVLDLTPEPIPVNPQNTTIPINNNVPINGIVEQPVMPLPEITNNQIPQSSPVQEDDSELLKAFVGKNYHKISTRIFSFSGFFFTSLYMFYRKMFLCALLVFILNLIVVNFIPINMFVTSTIFNIIIGFIVNKIYMLHAKRKVSKLKNRYRGCSLEQLKMLCYSKGGTSGGYLFLGLIIEIVIAILLALLLAFLGLSFFIKDLIKFGDFNPLNISFNVKEESDDKSTKEKDSNETNIPSPPEGALIIENATMSGYSCYMQNCTISIRKSNDMYDQSNDEQYKLEVANKDAVLATKDLTDLVKIDLYYIEKDGEKTITYCKIIQISNNKDISYVKDESELRKALGLYSEGKYTEKMTLKDISSLYSGYEDETTYNYVNLEFTNNKGTLIEMEYRVDKEPTNLKIGKEYTVTFEVTQPIFSYEYKVISIK